MNKAVVLLCLTALTVASAGRVSGTELLQQHLTLDHLRQDLSSVYSFLNGFAEGTQNSTANLCINSFGYISSDWDNFVASFMTIDAALNNILPSISYLRFWADAMRDNINNCQYSIIIDLWIGLLSPANLAEYVIKYLTAQDLFNTLYAQLITDYLSGTWFSVGFDVGKLFSAMTNFAY